MSVLDCEYFKTEEAAYTKLESLLWPDGPVCPKCGLVNDAHKIAANPERKVRYGLYRCNSKECGVQFTVTVGTVFESSHIPLHKWLQAAHLLNSSKKGISAKQIERILQITYKSAWFMMHRLREAMAPAIPEPMGGAGKVVEVDETYLGKRTVVAGEPFYDPGWGTVTPLETKGQKKIIALVERGGSARSFPVARMDKATVTKIMREHIARQSALHTDESAIYSGSDRVFAAHETVNHSDKEYARGDVTTNTVEGYFSIFKRGMKGVYQHCAEKHLHRYLAEFDFRYSNRERLGIDDTARTARALKGASGKRLTYQISHD